MTFHTFALATHWASLFIQIIPKTIQTFTLSPKQVKQNQVNNANSAFILINLLISQGCHSGSFGQDDPGGPGGPCGPGGSGSQGGQGGQGGQGCRDGQDGQDGQDDQAGKD